MTNHHPTPKLWACRTAVRGLAALLALVLLITGCISRQPAQDWPTTIGTNLNFTTPATVVINVGTFESTITNVEVFWNTESVFTTSNPTDPGLASITASPVNTSNTLTIVLTNATGSRTYEKTGISASNGYVSLARL